MRIVKRILAVVGVLLVILNIAGLFFDRIVTITVNRSVPGSPLEVYPYLSSPRQFTEWSPWSKKDTEMVTRFVGPDQGAGAGMEWSGNSDVGTGSWTVSYAHRFDRVGVHLNVEGMGTSEILFALRRQADSTVVSWSITKDMGAIPMFRLMTPLFTSYINEDFSQGLHNLSSLLSATPHGRVESTDVVELAAMHIISMRDTVATTEVGATIARMFGTIMPFLHSSHLDTTVDGPPMVIYHSWDDQRHLTDMEAAIRTEYQLKSATDFSVRTLDSGRFVKVVYYGPYEQSAVGHDAAHAYAKEHGYTLSTSSIEMYVTDPLSNKDQRTWQTDIYYRITNPGR